MLDTLRYYFGRLFQLFGLFWYFPLLVPVDGLFAVQSSCLIFLSLLLDIIKMSITAVSFLGELDSGFFQVFLVELWSKLLWVQSLLVHFICGLYLLYFSFPLSPSSLALFISLFIFAATCLDSYVDSRLKFLCNHHKTFME